MQVHKGDGNRTNQVQSDGSSAVQMWSAVAASVGVQVCPAFTLQPDAAAKTASRSQRDEDINAQRGTRGGRGVSEWTE